MLPKTVKFLLLTKKGQAVRCKVSEIRETNRGSKGVKLIGLADRDHLVGVSEVVKLDEDLSSDDETPEGENEPDVDQVLTQEEV